MLGLITVYDAANFAAAQQFGKRVYLEEFGFVYSDPQRNASQSLPLTCTDRCWYVLPHFLLVFRVFCSAQHSSDTARHPMDGVGIG